MDNEDIAEVIGSVISKVAVSIWFSVSPTLKHLRIFCNESYNKKWILDSTEFSYLSSPRCENNSDSSRFGDFFSYH